jgi:hypothetical protein
MYKRTGIIFALALIILGGVAFIPEEVKAGSPSVTEVHGPCRLKQFCKVFGDETYYCEGNPPARCPNGQPVPTPSPTPDFLTGGQNSKSRLHGPGPAAGEPETASRQTWTALLSLLVLTGGGVVLLSLLLKLCRNMVVSTSTGPASWLQPIPYAAGFTAVIAVVALASAGWLSVRNTQASGESPAARHSRIQQSDSSSDPQFSSAFAIAGTGITQVGGAVVDNNGNTYVAGGFFGEIIFDTAPQPTTLTSTEAYDVFVAKFDSAGKPLWVRMAKGATDLSFTDPDSNSTEEFSLDGALSLAVDASGNAYVGGGFVKSLSFEDAGGNTVATLGDDAEAESDEINFELFVAKYDAAGTLIWARGGDSGSLDDAEAEEDLDSGINGITEIVVDQSGNPYVAGTFSGTNFLGHAVTAEGARDILLARLNPANGDPIWVSTPGSPELDAVMGLAIDNAANLYMIGDMGGTISFPTQPQATTLVVDDEFRDSFVAKYSQTGQVLWAKQIGGTQPIDGAHIAVNGAGQLYLTGAFEGEARFDSITVTDPSAGSGSSGFLTKYTTNGNALWVRVFGRSGGGAASASNVAGYRVTVDRAGAPYVSGIFQEEATFGRETPGAARTLLSGRIQDQFVAHYDAAGNFRWVKQPVAGGDDSVLQFGSDDVPIQLQPMRLTYNDAVNAILLAGDFRGTLQLDAITLDSGAQRHAYAARLPLPQVADSSSTVQFSSADYFVSEGAGQIQITVTRSGDASNPATVDYVTSDGSAAQKGDYQAAVGTLRFGPGDTSQTFRVLVVDDRFVEGPETINISLKGTAIGDFGTASITIADDDTVAPVTNPIDDTGFFVRQHYLDFLNREPDPQGFAFWKSEIDSCGNNAQCREVKRVNVSAAFFLSIEFRQTGFLAYRFHQAAFNSGEHLGLQQFLSDANDLRQEVVVGQGNWQQQLEANKQAFANVFVQRPAFMVRYPTSQTSAQYVDALNTNTGGSLSVSERNALIAGLEGGTETRATVLRKVAENSSFAEREFNRAFVLMQYFGYLRRNPNDAPDTDFSGYNFWLGKLNTFSGDFQKAEMVKAFILSSEYRRRFGP